MLSYNEGRQAEEYFVKLRGNKIIRKASKEEDMNEHWDYLDEELGKVDVKAAKRKYRGGPIDYTIWWELLTVKRPPKNKPMKGWGVPNKLDRVIAVKSPEGFYILDPVDVYPDLKLKCKGYGRGEFLLHKRPNRGDLMTILPLSYVKEKSKCLIKKEEIV
jgi:hypothetical protein